MWKYLWASSVLSSVCVLSIRRCLMMPAISRSWWSLSYQNKGKIVWVLNQKTFHNNSSRERLWCHVWASLINDLRAWSQWRDLGTERTTGLRKESASYVKVIPATPKLTKGQAIETHLALLQWSYKGLRTLECTKVFLSIWWNGEGFNLLALKTRFLHFLKKTWVVLGHTKHPDTSISR